MHVSTGELSVKQTGYKLKLRSKLELTMTWTNLQMVDGDSLVAVALMLFGLFDG